MKWDTYFKKLKSKTISQRLVRGGVDFDVLKCVPFDVSQFLVASVPKYPPKLPINPRKPKTQMRIPWSHIRAQSTNGPSCPASFSLVKLFLAAYVMKSWGEGEVICLPWCIGISMSSILLVTIALPWDLLWYLHDYITKNFNAMNYLQN